MPDRMTDTLVFREEGRNTKGIVHCFEHNERTASSYLNKNIDVSLSGLNIYFKKPSGNYLAILQDKINRGEVNTKGLKKDASVFSEILVAVNRDFWEDKPDEYIKGFFQTAYEHLAGKFGEDNIISAVVHCDEISDGKVNYHMHVVALPVVEKKRYYSKRSKQYKKLADEIGEENIEKNDSRLYKDTEKQISHSKFFECHKEDHRMIYSYAVWQDELLGALRSAGYEIKRGTEGQKAKHLHPNQYKALMERIEYESEKLLPEIKAEEKGGSLIVDRASYDRMLALRSNTMKEKAAFDMAVEALQTEQAKVYERQHKAYALYDCQIDLNKNYEELAEDAASLRAENRTLKEQVEKLFQCFRKVWDCLVSILQNTTQPDIAGMTLSEYKKSLSDFITQTFMNVKQISR